MADRRNYFDNREKQNQPLYRMLERTTGGESIFQAYITDGYLEKNVRNLLTRLIVEDEANRRLAAAERERGVRYLNEFKVTKAQKENWSRQVANLFGGEKEAVYFSQFRHGAKRKIHFKGSFEQHLKYKRDDTREKGTLRDKPSQKQRKQQEREAAGAAEIIDSADERVAIEWLLNHLDPEDDVRRFWQISFSARQRLLKTNISLHDYYSRFPCLKVQGGIELLKSDFRTRYPGAEDFFQRYWLIRDHLIVRLQKHIQNTKVATLGDRGYIQSLGGLMQPGKDASIFYYLPYLFKQTPRQRRNNQLDPDAPAQRVNRLGGQERLDGFIIHVDTAAEVTPALNRERAKHQQAGTTFQPIPIFVGPLAAPTAFYVSMNNDIDEPTKYQVESPLHAIDLWFKATYILQLEYPKSVRQLCLFIQKGLFGIHNATDNSNGIVESLLGQLALANQRAN